MTDNTHTHTPGPWTIDYSINLSNGASCLIRAGKLGIAEVWKTDDGIARFQDDEVGQANAALIASAPDLLAALESLVEMDDDPIRYMACRSYRIDAARAAIEKARKGS